MNGMHRYILPGMMSLMLAACASNSLFDTKNVDSGLTPQSATTNVAVNQGKSVIWGGIIIAASNLKSSTEFEILAYPLDSSFRPRTDQTPLGRFIARQQGFLETTDYTQGRMMTVGGEFETTNQGRIGDSEYTYPVVNITQQHLWPRQGAESNTRFHLGIGVMFRN